MQWCWNISVNSGSVVFGSSQILTENHKKQLDSKQNKNQASKKPKQQKSNGQHSYKHQWWGIHMNFKIPAAIATNTPFIGTGKWKTGKQRDNW